MKGLSMRELFAQWWEQFRLCTIGRQHQEKMDSHGCCYRCGKRIR